MAAIIVQSQSSFSTPSLDLYQANITDYTPPLHRNLLELRLDIFTPLLQHLCGEDLSSNYTIPSLRIALRSSPDFYSKVLKIYYNNKIWVLSKSTM